MPSHQGDEITAIKRPPTTAVITTSFGRGRQDKSGGNRSRSVTNAHGHDDISYTLAMTSRRGWGTGIHYRHVRRSSGRRGGALAVVPLPHEHRGRSHAEQHNHEQEGGHGKEHGTLATAQAVAPRVAGRHRARGPEEASQQRQRAETGSKDGTVASAAVRPANPRTPPWRTFPAAAARSRRSRAGERSGPRAYGEGRPGQHNHPQN